MKDRLKELRKKLGIKQRELAERLGVKVGTIGDWESGKPLPRARAYQICKEYHVRREWLEKGEGEMFESRTLNVDVLRDQIVLLYDSLDDEAKGVFRAVAQGIVDAKDDTKKACENVKNAMQGFVNNGTNYGQQSVKFEK